MEWIKLLSPHRYGINSDIINNNVEYGRSEFQKDFDRIVFSSAFRRLQDKTQVFPMPESDFVHTRLTHSLEVSCVGRSLGNMVGERIIERYPALSSRFTPFHFGEIVSAACLGHDIGNPPFGHSGEDSIAEYFRSGNGQSFEQYLTVKQWNDLIKFEGNAQGFRILTSLQNPYVQGGLQLTYATLGAFVKYPKESFVENLCDTITDSTSKLYRKFGFFQAEKDVFSKIAAVTGLESKGNDKETCFWSRHPLSFLVEAADDICYRIMDLEDGFRLGLLSFDETEALLKDVLKDTELKDYQLREKNDRIGYLRAKSMSVLINEIADIFTDLESDILEGKFEDTLLSVVKAGKILSEIKSVSRDKIYSYRSVIEREVAGYEVLGGILDTFIDAVNQAANGKLYHKYLKILQLLPKQFLGANGVPDKILYDRLLKITDFVSGMTDSYAISLFRKIKGISLPNR